MTSEIENDHDYILAGLQARINRTFVLEEMYRAQGQHLDSAQQIIKRIALRCELLKKL